MTGLTNEQFIALATRNYPSRFNYEKTEYAGDGKTVLVQNRVTGDYHNILASKLMTAPDTSWRSDTYRDSEY